MLRYSCVVLLVALCIQCSLAANKCYNVYITSQKTGLVFDGSIKNLVVAESNKSDAQMWLLQANGFGPYFIRNKKTGNVLDLQKGCGKTTNIITYPYHGRTNQAFYVDSNGNIVPVCNVETKLTVDSKNNVGLGIKNDSRSDSVFLITKA